MKKTIIAGEKLKYKKFNIFKFNEKTRKSKLLGVVIAHSSPDAVGRAWKKFKIPRNNHAMSMIYARSLK